jgi:hypothetical protein
MTSLSSSDGQPKSRNVVLGLIILLILIAAVIGISFLSNPCYALAEVVSYAGLMAVVAAQLRTCLRLARGSEYSSKLHLVAFWVVVAVFLVVARLGDLMGTENRDYIRLATSGAAYLALLFSLKLAEQLLRWGAAGISSTPDAGTSAGATSPPKPYMAPAVKSAPINEMFLLVGQRAEGGARSGVGVAGGDSVVAVAGVGCTKHISRVGRLALPSVSVHEQ